MHLFVSAFSLISLNMVYGIKSIQYKIKPENPMCSLVGAACSGLGCPTAAAAGTVLRWPEEAPGVQVGAASLGLYA